jgi:hypothetical protein
MIQKPKLKMALSYMEAFQEYVKEEDEVRLCQRLGGIKGKYSKYVLK